MSVHSVNRSVFVSELSPEVTETDLLNAFCSSGTIGSVRVVRDRHSGLSLGYAYVNFLDEFGARLAIDNMNFARIKGQQIRVMAFQTDPELLKSRNKSNVFVKNLDKSVDNKRLYDLFQPYGLIISSKVAQEVDGKSKGYGFVQFESEESAVAAIFGLNGRLLDGKPLFCGKFMTKSERQKYTRDDSVCKSLANVYVKNLSHDFDDNVVKELFGIFGKVIAVKVFHKPFKNFAFLAFTDSVSAEEAIRVLNGKRLTNGNALYVSRAYKRVRKTKTFDRLAEKRVDSHGVYVKYLDNSFDGQSLRQLFSPFGSIRSVLTNPRISLLCQNDTFGYVLFSSPESALNAVQQMNNKIVAKRPIYVSLSEKSNHLKGPSLLNRIERNELKTFDRR